MATNLMDDVKDSARLHAGEQQRAAAAGMGEFARNLRQAAGANGGSDTLSARAARGVADRLERLAGTLESKDVGAVARQAEDFARREPLLFFGAAVAAGFVAMRLLKDAAPSAQDIKERL